jgi:hypothetical protein
MTGTDTAYTPGDPAMARPDPAMFAPLTYHENSITSAHLTSGWCKQAAVYPGLSEPWKETGALLDDLLAARRATPQAAAEPEAS